MDSVLEEGVPAVQAYEVLQQLPETTGSFVITQPQDNSSAVQSGFSEHIIVQTVPVSQVPYLLGYKKGFSFFYNDCK